VTDSSPDLIARARAGDGGAFEALYRAHVGRVYALCLRLEADARRAEELTQDVFVRAWERLATYRGDAAFGTWLHRLAVNVVMSDRRSAWRHGLRLVSGGAEIDEVAEPPGRARSDGGLDAIDLDHAIAGLPPGARAVFVLHDVEGYQHAEIASMAGIAEGTSKAQLFRARRLLREVLER
jgi:RNA polymerase sigma-70 factor (ECF subfamily)